MTKRYSSILLVFFLASGALAAQTETLVIPGTGVSEFLLKEIAAAYNLRHPGQEVIVPSSVGSAGGIRLVEAEEAVLGRVAGHVEDKVKALGLAFIPFARDAVVFAVGAKVEVDNLSTAQIVAIYQGRITNWQEVGGRPGVIRVLTRQPGDSVSIQIGRRIPEFQAISYPADSKMVHHAPEMGKMLEKYQRAIGMGTRSSLLEQKASMKLLAVDGVKPDPENICSGKYTLWEEYALTFKETRLTPLARDFLDFIFSPPGQEIMRKYEVMPLERKAR
jgi:phosphate transport system substrate-binding protein